VWRVVTGREYVDELGGEPALGMVIEPDALYYLDESTLP
jgi:hypothetical protein